MRIGFWLVVLIGLLEGALLVAASNSPLHTTVVRACDSQVVRLLSVDADRVRKLLDAALLKYTETQDIASAWRKIVAPSDRVGIKIQTSPGPVMSTRHAVVEAVINGLEQSGISRNRILIFDRYAPQMETAGYRIGHRQDGVIILATVPQTGYVSLPELDFPIPGKLIWGDLEFKEGFSEKDDQVSSKSHFTRILTQQVDKIINVAVPMVDPTLGLYACQLNVSLSLIDNYRRFQRSNVSREDSLTELFSNPLIQQKCVLHILDALITQYAGGPFFNPSYCWESQTLYLSRDAVALDSLILQQINKQRPKVEVAPLKKEEVAYLKAAADANLGITDPARIDIVEVK